MEMPIGIILYDEDYKIEWANPFMGAWVGEEAFIGHSLNLISEDLVPFIKSDAREEIVNLKSRKFEVHFKKKNAFSISLM